MTTAATTDQAWLDEAVRLASANVATGGGPFGAVIVRGDELISTGVNRVVPTLDPTAHAEVVAIREACQRVGDFRLTGCVLFSSCEPCPLCLAASLWARVDRVVFAADRNDAADAGFNDRDFYDLFEQPKQTWPIPVLHVRTADHNTPFSAWLSRTDRVEY
ncbi:nucleoside deaminase [Kutzneria sp. NPDC051319]|uniref:nucleoside deaminase n=1 Tax=Kutzneria sp. NPDC051319 TaxID=3155047 RepID=UPI0034185AE5